MGWEACQGVTHLQATYTSLCSLQLILTIPFPDALPLQLVRVYELHRLPPGAGGGPEVAKEQMGSCGGMHCQSGGLPMVAQYGFSRKSLLSGYLSGALSPNGPNCW